MGRYNKGTGKQIRLRGVVGGALLGATLAVAAAGVTEVHAGEEILLVSSGMQAEAGIATEDSAATQEEALVKIPYYDVDGYGWKKEGEDIVYINKNGLYQKNWFQDADGKWYFFGRRGVMQKGFIEWKNQKYYLAGDGSMTEGWLKLEDGVYYFRPDNGDMFTGEQMIDGVLYDFGTDGKAAGLVDIPSKPVVEEDDNQTADSEEATGDVTETDAPAAEENAQVLYDVAGYGWKQNEDRSWSYINKDGTIALYWLLDDTKYWYFLGADGKRHTGILILDNIPYNFDEEGRLLTGWQTINEATYFFDSVTGRPVTGVVLIDGIQYGFNAEYKLDMSVIPWDLVLVNYQNSMPENYQIPLSYVSGYKVDTRMAASLQAMIKAAKKDGISLKITSAYRTLATQTRLFNNGLTKRLNAGMSYEAAVAERNLYNAEPGKSEHNLGLALDFIAGGALDESFAGSSQAAWLMEHAHEYGFILRYTAEKVDITRIAYEPWHYRYVGVNTATYIREHGICFEELFASYCTKALTESETAETADEKIETSDETVEVAETLDENKSIDNREQ